jgi:hypothetical protein
LTVTDGGLDEGAAVRGGLFADADTAVSLGPI